MKFRKTYFQLTLLLLSVVSAVNGNLKSPNLILANQILKPRETMDIYTYDLVNNIYYNIEFKIIDENNKQNKVLLHMNLGRGAVEDLNLPQIENYFFVNLITNNNLFFITNLDQTDSVTVVCIAKPMLTP